MPKVCQGCHAYFATVMVARPSAGTVIGVCQNVPAHLELMNVHLEVLRCIITIGRSQRKASENDQKSPLHNVVKSRY